MTLCALKYERNKLKEKEQQADKKRKDEDLKRQKSQKSDEQSAKKIKMLEAQLKEERQKR